MSENSPENMEETLKLIEKLQAENAQLHKDNFREMLIKSRKMMFGKSSEQIKNNQNGVTLFRQEQYWRRNGVELDRNTLVNRIIRSSLWLKPLWELRIFDIPVQ